MIRRYFKYDIKRHCAEGIENYVGHGVHESETSGISGLKESSRIVRRLCKFIRPMLRIAARYLIEAELEELPAGGDKEREAESESRTIGRSHCFLSRFCMAVASS